MASSFNIFRYSYNDSIQSYHYSCSHTTFVTVKSTDQIIRIRRYLATTVKYNVQQLLTITVIGIRCSMLTFNMIPTENKNKVHFKQRLLPNCRTTLKFYPWMKGESTSQCHTPLAVAKFTGKRRKKKSCYFIATPLIFIIVAPPPIVGGKSFFGTGL